MVDFGELGIVDEEAQDDSGNVSILILRMYSLGTKSPFLNFYLNPG